MSACNTAGLRLLIHELAIQVNSRIITPLPRDSVALYLLFLSLFALFSPVLSSVEHCMFYPQKSGSALDYHILLGESKYGPGSGPQWKTGGSRYPNLYKAFLEEPSRTLRTQLLEDNSCAKVGDGRIVRRPTRIRRPMNIVWTY